MTESRQPRRQEAPKTIARLTAAEKEYMVAAAILRHDVFVTLRDRVPPTHLCGKDAYLGVAWRAAGEAAVSCGGLLPTAAAAAFPVIDTRVRAILERSTDLDRAAVHAELYGDATDSSAGFLQWVMSVDPASIVFDFAINILVRFLTERLHDSKIRNVVDSIRPGDVLADPQAFADEVARDQAAIVGLTESPAHDPFPAVYIPQRIETVSTGVSFLDEFTRGGLAPGEVGVILAGTGGGKSMMATQLCCAGARHQAALAMAGDPSAGYWYYVSYEMPIKHSNELKHRLLANMGEIHIDTLTDGAPLSTTGNYKPYELERYAPQLAHGLAVPGEQERFNATSKYGGKHGRLQLLDFSGSHPGRGTGGVRELEQFFLQEEMAGRKIAGFVIDYAGICVERLVKDTGKLDATAFFMNSFVDDVRMRLTIPRRCVGWVMHQLHGDATRRNATAKTHHSEAKGSRNFADNANFAFILSARDDSHGSYQTIRCTKHRRTPGRPVPIVIQLDASFCQFLSKDQTHAVDGDQIVERSLMGRVIRPVSLPQGFSANLSIGPVATDAIGGVSDDASLWGVDAAGEAIVD